MKGHDSLSTKLVITTTSQLILFISLLIRQLANLFNKTALLKFE